MDQASSRRACSDVPREKHGRLGLPYDPTTVIASSTRTSDFTAPARLNARIIDVEVINRVTSGPL